jgi:hypothetical protein
MRRSWLLITVTLPLLALTACGGDSAGGVASTPTPAAPAGVPAPVPAVPNPSINYDTAEYRLSGAAKQAQAIAAYDAGATGAGITVGVIDSGVNASSAEFSGRISSASRDFAGSRGLTDDGGHGTAVADVLLGAKNDSGIHGVAFNSTLLVLKTDTPGTCSTTLGSAGSGCTHGDNNIAAALDAAVAAQARVVNISLGGSSPNSNLRAAVGRATAAGTIIVISAGNDGAANPDSLAQIANDPNARGLVIIAGAVDDNGVIADFSNRAGSSAANYLTALGVRVRSVDQTGTAYLFSGTSFSTPVISGAIALLAQAFPNLTPEQLVALLYRSATDRGAAGVDATYGNGELNIARAFQPIGSTSLSNSAVPVSLTGNATLGGAMGDSGQHGMSAVVRDEFGRDFNTDLAGTIRRTGMTQPLSAALSAQGSRGMSAAGRRTSFAISIDNAGQGERLMLSSAEASRARVLAGAMSFSVSKTLKFGFGAGRGADGLVPMAQDRADAPFLIADRSLDRAPNGAFAIRQKLGRAGLTLSAESGDMRLWERGLTGPRGDGYRRYTYGEVSVALDMVRGPFTATAKLTHFNETATVLGGRFDAAMGGSGAVTWFGDAALSFDAGDNWRITGQLRQGWTSLGANAVRGNSTLVSRALSAGVERQGLLMADDSFAFRYAEPLRVTGGALALDLAGTGYQAFSLAPQGHERDWEAVYARPLGTGWLTANAYVRQQPGHFAAAPNDIGAAVRYSVNF